MDPSPTVRWLPIWLALPPFLAGAATLAGVLGRMGNVSSRPPVPSAIELGIALGLIASALAIPLLISGWARLAVLPGLLTLAMGALTLARSHGAASLAAGFLAADIPRGASSWRSDLTISIATLLLVLLGSAASLLASHHAAVRRPGELMAALASTIGWIAFSWYAFGGNGPADPRPTASAGAVTALSAAFLGAALLTVRGRDGICGFLFGPDPGAALARQALPAALLAPFLIGLFAERHVESSAFGEEFGLTLVTVAVTAVVICLVLLFARRLEAAERRTRIVSRRLAIANAALERRVVRRTEELAEARDAAERANKAKTDFLAAMSHEIRTPLTSVLGIADLLATEPLSDRQNRYVRSIRSSGQQLLSVVNDILDFSKLRTGRIDLERLPFLLDGLLEEVVSVMSPRAHESRVWLRIEKGEGVPKAVVGDPTRLKQILFNLVGNALKFTEAGGVTVRVTGTTRADGAILVRFTVVDTGIGMSEMQQARIFEDFVQGDISMTRRYGGSGLGLAICKRLTEAMDGQIGVRSRLGEGSSFWVELPLRASETTPEDATPPSTAIALEPQRILLAEDIEVNRDLVCEALGRQGHTVVAVGDGQAAVDTARGGGFDIILMDVQMPIMDGIEATRRIRGLPPPVGTVPIIALTASVLESARPALLNAGMNDWAMKPIVWNQLFELLARYGGKASSGKASAPPGPAPANGGSLDVATIEGLRQLIPAAKLGQMLAAALEGAANVADKLADGGLSEAETARLAHQIRGTLGTYGFVEIGRLAAEIEDRALSGHHVEPLVPQLAHAVLNARHELTALLTGGTAAEDDRCNA